MESYLQEVEASIVRIDALLYKVLADLGLTLDEALSLNLDPNHTVYLN